ncbi:Hypoxia-inducible factor 1-alpha [Geodia barretti]|nr:Hypoxia-inducible factor 1-alpha [Geodia barretti]
MGTSLYDLVLEEDQTSVKLALSSAEIKAHTRIGTKRVSVPCSFFCRMRCSRNKIANTQSKSPGYKVVHTSGYFQLHGSEAFLVALVKPVTPPSILEIRMEGNMFVTHYALDMHCTFFDGRLNHLMGYGKEDLRGKLAFDFHHHDDTDATLECSRGVQARGEGMSGYYRMITKHGQFVWLQTRATMMFDSHTGNPSYIVCMNFIINKEKGIQSVGTRKALPAPPLDSKTEGFISEEKSKAHDPFPIPREDGMDVNPLSVDPSDKVSADSLSFSSSSLSGRKPGTGAMKMEAESPPHLPPLPNTEEPSSTTGPPPSIRGSSSDVSSGAEVGGRFHDPDHTPSSGGGMSNECVPDSTSAGEASPGYDINRAGESGYNTRTSSYSARPKKTPSDSDSTGTSSTVSPSVIFIGDGGISHGEVSRSSSNSGVSAVLSYAGSSTTVLEPEPSSVYQDPVIQELPSVTMGRDSEPLRPSCRRQSAGGLPPQNTSVCHHQQLQQKPLSSNGGQQQPLSYQGGQQQQPLIYQGDQQQPHSYQGGQQQPLSYQGGQQQQLQQPIVYQSDQQQQPLSYQSDQQQQPLSYQSGQQQPLSYQGGQQQPLSYQSGQQQQLQQPIVYQSDQQQQPLSYQSGQQQPLSYQSDQQQQPLSYQSDQQQQPLSYLSSQQQPLSYQSNQQQPLSYQSSQQQPLSYQSSQQQPLSYQSGQHYQQPLNHIANHAPSTIPVPRPGYVSQQQMMKQEATQPPCRYSNPTQTGTGTSWQGNEIGTQQYQYQPLQRPSYQLHHENSSSFAATNIKDPHQRLLQNLPIDGGFLPPHQMAPSQSHTHQITPQSHSQVPPPQGYTNQMTSSQFQTQHQQVPLPHNFQSPTFQAPPPTQNPLPQNQHPGGLNPQTLPLLSTLDQSNSSRELFSASTNQPAVPPSQCGVAEGPSGNGNSFASIPLSHPQQFANPQTTGVGVAGNMGHVTSNVTPDLINLTGEDLQILDFIDTLGTGGGGGFAQPLASSHLHTK